MNLNEKKVLQHVIPICVLSVNVKSVCGSQTLTLNCVVGILNVLSANYGRLSSTICPSSAMYSLTCSASQSLSIMQARLVNASQNILFR